MSSESTAARHVSLSRAVRHHLPVVLVFFLLGAVAGYLYAGSVPTAYTSTARVLVNPSVGNPFVPTPSSVRQDELTSLETEAQVARSDDVLGAVHAQYPDVSLATMRKNIAVLVPANTQVLEISFTAGNADTAQAVTNAVADAYLANRAQRFETVNNERIARVETRTDQVVTDLRTHSKAAKDETQSAGDRLFEQEMADALRNELVSLRAQRTALENSEAPTGSVIAPAVEGKSAAGLTATILPFAFALVGLAIGCAIALLLERSRGVVRSRADVEALGVPVVASIPRRTWRERMRRHGDAAAIDTTVRRVRATLLDLEPRPDVVAIAPVGSGRSDANVSEAVAESFAKAGHRVVLVRADRSPSGGGIGVDDKGLAQALMYERLNVVDLLQPSVEPLLSLLNDGGFNEQSRELLVSDRIRSVLTPLVTEGHLVIIQSPGIDSAEGEAFLGAADLGVVVVRTGKSRPGAVEQIAELARTKGLQLTALVVGRHGPSRRNRVPADVREDGIDQDTQADRAERSERSERSDRAERGGRAGRRK
ncbi:Wzz/FepE/Etk N-terminal domain-containing protein [uncultured Nocardioides sp.]|uniref:Wzz/FepE/Etk N-terminal domain-containing protein n=1 Tax=uncultured Nocardioides sp. TaxID=198441 RepID=UPI0026354FB2|nr:Wzz/FepE/Etk N-terminal domain-containing protein [uncultured Nocardioides sp.]